MKVYTDFDGTLSKGYISMDFMDFLFFERLYREDSYEAQQNALKDYKDNIISYDAWCEQWGILWAEGMKGQKTKDVEDAARIFYDGFRKNIYPSSYDIIKSLRMKYDVAMISVGANEVVSIAAEDLGIREVYATTLESYDRYTGRILTGLHLAGGKETFLKKEKEQFIGLGDSHGDIGFLRMAKISIAMNPDNKLKEYAKSKDWLVLDSSQPSELLIERISSKIHEKRNLYK
jgi:phosphoserine phosphatase